jgi:sugar lactone lactonase YvrE
VERNPGVTGADLKLTLQFTPLDPGSPGREQIRAVVKNNTLGTVGANDQGTVTGIDLCIVNTVFKDASNTIVSGGGYFGYNYLNPTDGTPVFNLPKSVASGAAGQGPLISIIVPSTATTATLTTIVRTATAFGNPPDLTRWYLTTLAGKGTSGFQDGSAAQALFNDAPNAVYRDALGDLLVADMVNNRVRRISQGQVTTFAGDGTSATCHNPWGVAQDPQGNVYIGENTGSCVDIVPATGGTITTIAGSRGSSGDTSNTTGDQARFERVAGVAVGGGGNLVYACDFGTGKVKLLTYNGIGSRSDPTSWYVTDITNGAGFNSNAPIGVAVDAAGNVYVVDNFLYKVYVLPLGSNSWTVIAGSGVYGETDGTGLNATFQGPNSIAVDQAGILYVADYPGSLRRLTHTGGSLTDPTTWKVQTLVPSGSETDGFTGTGTVHNLLGVTCARDGTLYLTEVNDVRRLDRTRN